MTSSGYTSWFTRAFFHSQAALIAELASRHHLHITEEYLRSSFLKGLVLSRPDLAGAITKEKTPHWSSAKCWHDPTHAMGRGRQMQHDVFAEAVGGDHGAACEVKWLKASKAQEIVEDFWKLWLTRTTVPEGSACRCFLLAGGDAKNFASTLNAARAAGIDLRWSSAGAGEPWPVDRFVDIDALAGRPMGGMALRRVLSRGVHYRTPCDVWASARIVLRQRWLMRIPHGETSFKWRLAMWEINHRATESNALLNWAQVRNGVPFTC